MLCLNRRKKESIYITAPDGTLIVVTMLGTDRGAVSIGVSAPRSWQIDREEVWQRKQGEINGNVAHG